MRRPLLGLALLLRVAVLDALGLVRLDRLLVNQGLCHSRAAAKTLIQDGLVTTKRGVVLRKSAANIDEDTVLLVLEEGAAGSPAGLAATTDAPGAGDEHDESEVAPLAPARPQAVKQSAASKAARRRNAKEGFDGTFGAVNANGLHGRGKKAAGDLEHKHKRYSK